MIVIHHNDLDGRCSAAIVNYASILRNDTNIRFIEADYHHDFSYLVEDLNSNALINSTIYIVDFSLQPKLMELVRRKTKDVVWIDHHKTAEGYPYQDLHGLRNFKDKEKAGCELTWQYFYPIGDVPDVVVMIGDYDKWALKYAPDCFEVYEGLKLEDQSPTNSLWRDLFESNDALDRIRDNGKTVIKYRDNYCAEICKAYGYEVFFEGHNAYAVNLARFGSQQFGELFEKYPFCISYIHNGVIYTVSLYSRNVDVGEICKKYGGGGHKGAAGFTCDRLPFSALMSQWAYGSGSICPKCCVYA